jgi:UDP-2,3-diacylglucosamine pyrophosphatase LpxH
MILIADAHISAALGNTGEFFQMLQALESSDQDLVFLGDIFDLWIALPRYENALHRRFLAWCDHQKHFRRIGFIEGNREYCLAAVKARHFSWCSDAAGYADERGNLFCHGDQVNRRDKNYLRFRKFAKHPGTRLLMRILPFGPYLARRVQIQSKQTNLDFRRALPEEEIRAFADTCFRQGALSVFVGHFHQVFCHRLPDGRALHTVPDWQGTGLVTAVDEDSGRVRHVHWTGLATK